MQIRPFLPTGGRVTPIQLLIFIQLLESPKYGYEILSNLHTDFEGIWMPKTGTIYPALKSLVRRGLITGKEVEGTIFYELTDSGIALVQDSKEIVRDYVTFNYRFMKIAAERLPSTFITILLQHLYESGIDDIIPESSIISAIRETPDQTLRKNLLLHRKKILLAKLACIRNELKEIEREAK